MLKQDLKRHGELEESGENRIDRMFCCWRLLLSRSWLQLWYSGLKTLFCFWAGPRNLRAELTERCVTARAELRCITFVALHKTHSFQAQSYCLTQNYKSCNLVNPLWMFGMACLLQSPLGRAGPQCPELLALHLCRRPFRVVTRCLLQQFNFIFWKGWAFLKLYYVLTH